MQNFSYSYDANPGGQPQVGSPQDYPNYQPQHPADPRPGLNGRPEFVFGQQFPVPMAPDPNFVIKTIDTFPQVNLTQDQQEEINDIVNGALAEVNNLNPQAQSNLAMVIKNVRNAASFKGFTDEQMMQDMRELIFRIFTEGFDRNEDLSFQVLVLLQEEFLERKAPAPEPIIVKSEPAKPAVVAEEKKENASQQAAGQEAQLEEDEEQKKDKLARFCTGATRCEVCESLFNSRKQYLTEHENMIIKSSFNCSHTFHTGCLVSSVLKQARERKLPLKCPECRVEVCQDLFPLILNEEELQMVKQKLLMFAIIKNPRNYFICPSKRCGTKTKLDRDWQGPVYECEGCKKKFCLDCRQISNPATCFSSHEVHASLSKIISRMFTSCPRCKFWGGQLSSDCDHADFK